MWKITVIAFVAVLSKTSYCQFGFSAFGENQQNNPFTNFNSQRQTNFAFPQSDFVFPNFSPQQYQSQRPNNRPQNNNNYGRPPNFGQQEQQGGRPKPTFAIKHTTVRTTPLSFAPQSHIGTLQTNRIDERISQTSKKHFEVEISEVYEKNAFVYRMHRIFEFH